MERRTRPKLNTQIYEEATNWFVKARTGDLDDAGCRELDQWLRRSPEHLSAYIEIAAIWNEGPTLDPLGKYDAATLIRDATADSNNVVPLVTASGSRAAETKREQVADEPRAAPRRSGLRQRYSIAAAAMIATVGGLLAWQHYRAPTYMTDVGEQRSIALADGSLIELNSRSKVRVRYTDERRDVELLEGQALFRVAKDHSRAFIVSADGTRVRAVGTQFDVYKKRAGTIVTVVEGRVAVSSRSEGGSPQAPRPDPSPGPVVGDAGVSANISPGASAPFNHKDELLVTAGEQLTVTEKAAQKTEHANVASAIAWTQRRLVFESAPLIDVVEEFNRYNQRQIAIRDPELYRFRISGVFSSTEPDSLLRFLRSRRGVQISESESRVEIFRDEATR